MLMLATTIIAVFWLAWSNGANDNFKGVATLYGSGAATYRTALVWSTLATLAGCLLSIIAATGLAKAFSGSGLVPADLAQAPSMLLAVAAAGAVTILLATFLGMPTSTTHALTGGLVGAGLAADPAGVNWGTLTQKFAQPLLLSPVLAIGGAAILYVVMRAARRSMGITSETCVCVGRREYVPVAQLASGGITAYGIDGGGLPTVAVGSATECSQRYMGRVAGVNAQTAVDWVHYLSGSSVCFARAVNDTPKIAALLLVTGGSFVSWQLALVTAAVVAGGLLSSRRVARTMSKRITDLNHGQGVTANLVTAGLVLGASHLGVPVSTTHVSCGSIFGIGLVNRQVRWKTIIQILVTWVTTLPLGLALGAGIFWALGRLGA